MKPGTENEPFPLPPALLAQVQVAAEEEHRPTDEIVREAVERYLASRRRQKLRAYGEAQAHKLGISSQEDVERVVHEYREEERERQNKEHGR